MRRLQFLVLLACISISVAGKAGGAFNNQAVLLPTGRWVFFVDVAGNEFAVQPPAGSAYYRIEFNFIMKENYEFSLQEYDAAGTVIKRISEAGSVDFTETQFTLYPKKSETTEFTATPGLKPVASTTSNRLIQDLYNWELQQLKGSTNYTLIITAIKPGPREGIPGQGSNKQLSPEKRKSIARSM